MCGVKFGVAHYLKSNMRKYKEISQSGQSMLKTDSVKPYISFNKGQAREKKNL